MADKKYLTIDPLILETLNLNEKRIHHIFDILHGRDSKPLTDRVLRSATHSSSVAPGTLPKLHEQQVGVSSSRLSSIKKQRNYSASLIEPKTPLQNIKQQNPGDKADTRPRKQRGKQKQNSISISQSHSLVSPESKVPPTDKRLRLVQDYGMHRIRNAKSMELHPKDLYRIEIEGLVSKLTPVEELEDAQKLMRRLKRRYQHLRRFDQLYYSKLNQSELLIL